MTENAGLATGVLAPMFQLHGVTFRVTRLHPRAGLAVLEYVRPELAALPANSGGALVSLFSEPSVLAAIEKIGLPSDLAMMVVRLMNLVLSLPPNLIERLRVDLFHNVQYRTPDMSDFAMLFKMEDDAFAAMPFSSQYVVLGRAAAVNFYDCISEVLSLTGGSLNQE